MHFKGPPTPFVMPKRHKAVPVITYESDVSEISESKDRKAFRLQLEQEQQEKDKITLEPIDKDTAREPATGLGMTARSHSKFDL